jgi:hypothetical protein
MCFNAPTTKSVSERNARESAETMSLPYFGRRDADPGAETQDSDRLRLSACCGLRRAQAQAVLRRILYWMAILRDSPETYMGYTSHNKNGFI